MRCAVVRDVLDQLSFAKLDHGLDQFLGQEKEIEFFCLTLCMYNQEASDEAQLLRGLMIDASHIYRAPMIIQVARHAIHYLEIKANYHAKEPPRTTTTTITNIIPYHARM
jgi:hypothetical protein